MLELDDGTDCDAARKQAERKLADVRVRLADLRRIEQVLAELVARCSAATGPVRCPLIASLEQG